MLSTRKPTFSPTRIASFLECAVKYRYIYLDKIGRFYQKPRGYFSLGSSLHSVLKQFHDGGCTFTLDEMTSTFASSWISAGYSTPEEEALNRVAGDEMVRAYYADWQNRRACDVQTISVERTFTRDMGAWKLSGRIDRLDMHSDGVVEIVDYKSGRLQVTEEEIANDLAMRCYMLLVQSSFPQHKVCATIYCLRSGATATASMTADEQTEFIYWLNSLCDEIMAKDFQNQFPVRMEICADCDFLRVCRREWARAERENQTPFELEGDRE